jgi:hypothetical protein
VKSNHESSRIKAVAAAVAFLAAFASIVSGQVKPNRNLERFNTIRIAKPPVPSVFLGRMINFQDTAVDHWFKKYRNAGYNYVMVPVSIIDTTDPALTPVDDSLISHLRLTVRKAAQYGLRVIPQIGIGSNHSVNWERMSSTIQMNRQICNRCDNGRDYIVGTPSYAADPLGIDTNFARILIAIRRAFADSVVRYPLEYVQLSYDEFANNYSNPMRYGALLPLSGATWKYSDSRMSMPFSLAGGASWVRTISRAKVDSEFVANSGAPSQSRGVQQLVVNSLYRRLLQARNHLDPNIKVIIYADVFDAGFLGKLTYRTYDLDTVRFSGTLATLPGLTAPQAVFLRENLFLMPWYYGGPPYGYGGVFSQFTNSGFKTLYGVAIHNGDTQWAAEGRRAMGRYVDSSQYFKGSVLGYASQWWLSNPADTGQGDISVATYDSVKARSLFPRASIQYDQTAPIGLLLFR